MPESEPEVDQTLNDFATLLYTGFFIFRIQTLNPCLRILVCYHALSHPAINLRKFLYMLLNFCPAVLLDVGSAARLKIYQVPVHHQDMEAAISRAQDYKYKVL